MILNEKPGVSAAFKERGTQPGVAQQVCAHGFRQNADSIVGPDEPVHDPQASCDAAALLVQPPRHEILGFRGVIEIFGIAANERSIVWTAHCDGLEQVEPDIRQLRDREITSVGFAQPHREIGFPARKVDVLV